MIDNLRKRFIIASAASLFIVLSVIYATLVITSRNQLDHTMDTLTEAIASNGGSFPEFTPGAQPNLEERLHTGVITEETRFSTRFFTVWLGADGRILRVNTDAIFSISEAQTEGYAEAALKTGAEKDWISDYRYRIFEVGDETAIVFVNGEMNRMLSNRFLLTAFVVLFGSGTVILLLFILISKRIVRPAAESYEKQKQFITDAGHELKTPLTLILSNLDIVESETGKNEWLDDIRGEGERMRQLINQLITLSRMDELPKVSPQPVFLSNAVSDVVSEFEPFAVAKEKLLEARIEPDIFCQGEEGEIRRLVSILLDNAVKYCDAGGTIVVTLSQKRRPVLTVENTCREVEKIHLERLFDRFYREDKARNFTGSFGIGLSIAKAIVKSHHGEITAYKKEGGIGFRAELR